MLGRLKSRILQFAKALLLLLAVVTCVFWIRSLWATDFLWYERNKVTSSDFSDKHTWDITLASASNRIEMSFTQHAQLNWGVGSWRDYPESRSKCESWPGRDDDRSQFEYRTGNSTMGLYTGGAVWHSYFVSVRFPHWLPAIVFGCLPAFGGCRWLMRRRAPRSAHSCAQCGYDCRATPERCPECGTLRDPKKASTAAKTST